MKSPLFLFSSGLALISATLYPDSSPVLELSAVSYPKLITQSNYTSIVEFYAPWCGHCKSLKPAYERAATSLAGLANVAAINCDEALNKPLCGQMGIKGFPTLKIVKPGSKPGKPRVTDYQGERTAKSIVDTVIEEIPDHVARLYGEKIDKWIESTSGAKALLFTDKQAKSALYKTLAIDFLGSIAFAQIREVEKEAVKKYEITKFPTLLFLSGKKEYIPVAYDGKMKKADLVAFLSRLVGLNAQPGGSSAASKGDSKQKPVGSVTSDTPFTSPGPIVTPPAKVATDLPLPIPVESSEKELRALCLSPKSPTCIFILLAPSEEQAYSQKDPSSEPPTPQTNPPADVQKILSSLATLKQQYLRRHKSFFPVFAVDVNQHLNLQLRLAFGMTGEMQLLAVNGKRGWYNQYGGSSADRQDDKEALEWSEEGIGAWIDDLKLGNARKEKIAAELITEQEPVSGGRPAADVEEAARAEEDGGESERHDEL